VRVLIYIQVNKYAFCKGQTTVEEHQHLRCDVSANIYIYTYIHIHIYV